MDWLLALAAATLLIAHARAQQSLPDGDGGPLNSAAPAVPGPAASRDAAHSGIYRDLDLLRGTGFSHAAQASVSVRVIDPAGMIPPNLTTSDFTLVINGTPRAARVHAPGSSESNIAPMVLLVLPPNEPIVHAIAIRNAEKYFAAQSNERLPWSVGIFDANGKLSPFTNGRSQLLANLDVVDHAKESFQYAGNAGLPAGFQWSGSWMMKAEEAVGMMQKFDGPKVVLAINPLGERMYGLNDQMFAHDGPEAFTDIAKAIGAHIYIANVGGPEVYIPGGGAADDQPAQINTPAGPLLGTVPSYHQQVDPQMTAALNYFAYRTSMMMQTAADTLGGYANSLGDLAAKIHSDLDGNYALDFDMTAADTDQGVPSVEVRMTRHDLRVAILDVQPIVSAAEANQEMASRQMLDVLRRATEQPVVSPDFRITQRVDSFPLHDGLEPVLPMTGRVTWTGTGKAPAELYVVESVEDASLDSALLQRAVQARWNGQSLTWERDGQLRPGNYIWRVAVHDGRGKIFASTEQKIAIPFPRRASVRVSSVVAAKGCREDDTGSSGLQRRPAKGADTALAHFLIDPMRAGDCRVRPEADGVFTSADTLRAFVRIYPAERLQKHKPESWTAKFVLRAAGAGAVALEREIPFTVDSGSGYLASIEMPLGMPLISPGPYTLDVEMHGPGIRGEMQASRAISIGP
jgi:hypothetical protein